MEFQDFFYPSSAGTCNIRARKAVPAGGIRGIVQIAHGIAEHIERYDSFMEFLYNAGFAVCGNDHLGHGQSASDSSLRGFFAEKDGWHHVVEDVCSLHDLMRTEIPDPGIPYILFGHSMGSFIARTCIIDRPELWDMVILSGTGYKSSLITLPGSAIADAVCTIQGARTQATLLYKLAFGDYLSRIEHPKTSSDWLSRDEASVTKYLADPQCGFICKNGVYRDMFRALTYIVQDSSLVRMNKNTPVYFMSGDCDPVGDYGKGVETVYRMFCRIGCTDVTIRLYPGGRHEMLNELNREQVYQDILDWITARI